MSHATDFVTRALTADAAFDSTHQTAITNFIDGLDSNSLFAKYDAFYMLRTQSAAVAVLNLISTSFTLIANGSPAFAADAGYTGVDASTTVYLNTQFDPSSASSPKYVRNSAHLMAWALTNLESGASGGICMGQAAQTKIAPRYPTNGYYGGANNSAQDGPYTVSDSRGVFVANRSGASAVEHYRDASSLGTSTNASAAIAGGICVLLATAVVGSVSFGSALQLGAASIGGSLSSTDVSNLQTLINSYVTDLAGGGAVGQPTSRRWGGVPGMTPGGPKFGRTWGAF